MNKPKVYILLFDSGKYYVGSTTDLDARIKHHRGGHTPSTMRMGSEFKLVFFQEFDDLSSARTVERKIKSWKRKDFIEKIIRDGKITSVKGN